MTRDSWEFPAAMATDDFFRSRLAQMIDMAHPLAVLATRVPWTELEAALAPAFAHKDRAGRGDNRPVRGPPMPVLKLLLPCVGTQETAGTINHSGRENLDLP